MASRTMSSGTNSKEYLFGECMTPTFSRSKNGQNPYAFGEISTLVVVSHFVENFVSKVVVGDGDL
eukprot:UN09164